MLDAEMHDMHENKQNGLTAAFSTPAASTENANYPAHDGNACAGLSAHDEVNAMFRASTQRCACGHFHGSRQTCSAYLGTGDNFCRCAGSTP